MRERILLTAVVFFTSEESYAPIPVALSRGDVGVAALPHVMLVDPPFLE